MNWISITILLASCLTLKAQVPFSLQDRAFLASTSPLRVGLAGYWRLEEASGTRYDYSKNGNHLTSNNSVGQTTGVSAYTGNCASFVLASSQYLSSGSTSSLQGGNKDYTIAAWVRMTTIATSQNVITKETSTSGQREYALFYQSPVLRFNVYTNNNQAEQVSASNFGTVATNTWMFVLCWYDSTGKTANISVNNGAANTKSLTGVPQAASTAAFAIGRSSYPGFEFYLNGDCDEVGKWDRLLTSGEKAQLYHAGLGTHFPWAHP